MESYSGLIASMLLSRGQSSTTSAGDYVTPVDTDRVKFSHLVEVWRRETKYLSSVDDICEHYAYQQIIAMGWKALPFIFDEMQIRREQWFEALYQITGVDPVPAQDAGRMKLMAEHWLDWAARNDLA